MKVLFLQDVPKVGQKYQIKTVADGYARNFLLPNGFAQIATDSVMKGAVEMQNKLEGEQKIRQDLLAKNVADLKDKKIMISQKANEKGHLFAEIHKEAIVSAIKEQTGLDIDEAHIVSDEHIKEIGEHTIVAKVSDEIKVEFTLTIEALKD